MKTPLKKVRGLGAAHEGTGVFMRQRLTAIANIPLSLAFVALVVDKSTAPWPEMVDTLRDPFVALVLLAFILSATIHMRIGMQVIIEDYIHGERSKLAAIIANTLFAVAVGLTAAFAVLKVAFGV